MWTDTTRVWIGAEANPLRITSISLYFNKKISGAGVLLGADKDPANIPFTVFFQIVAPYQGKGPLRRRSSPVKRSPFASAIAWSLLPRAEQMDARLRFACLACIGGVHVKAVGAAVDLGCTDLDQFQQVLFKAGFLDLHRQIVPGFEERSACGVNIGAIIHVSDPFIGVGYRHDEAANGNVTRSAVFAGL